jgi:hypothetical protein
MMNFRLARAGVLADVTVRGHLRDGAAQEFATNGGGR